MYLMHISTYQILYSFIFSEDCMGFTLEARWLVLRFVNSKTPENASCLKPTGALACSRPIKCSYLYDANTWSRSGRLKLMPAGTCAAPRRVTITQPLMCNGIGVTRQWLCWSVNEAQDTLIAACSMSPFLGSSLSHLPNVDTWPKTIFRLGLFPGKVVTVILQPWQQTL